MPDIEIKRGYEVLPDNDVRFGIRVINNSDSAISDVEVLLDCTESLFELSGSRILKLGTIPPAVLRTAKFILKPLGCIHKENIGATIIYKDHQWKKHMFEMHPKEVHCVCPFLKEKSIKRADFLTLSKSGFFEERGVNFEGITVDKLVEFLSHTCKNRLYRVDELPIENGKIIYLAGDALGEKAYYLLTVVVKEYEGLAQVFLRANSDRQYGLNGFLIEIMDNLRHLVVSASAREIGVIRKEQVINIINSVVQRTTFAGGDGGASVIIKDSVVQRTEFKGEEEKKKREDERLRKEKEDEEHLKKQTGENKQDYFHKIKVQDETWIGCALLHYENPERLSFTVKELVDRVSRENIYGELRPGIQWHAYLHNVANKVPNPGKYRLLYATSDNQRRLYRDGDDYHPLREGRKTKPVRYEIPEKYHFLIDWYENFYNKLTASMEKVQEKPKGQKVEEKHKEDETTSKMYINSIGMKFILIPAGEFMMGSEEYDYEKPVHKVKISKPFYLGIYPVTQLEWEMIMEKNPSNFKGENLPVEKVSWNDVQAFIFQLNETEGTDKYRLPSEAEWEYAARSGTSTMYSFGDDESILGDYAWLDTNSGSKTHDVGQKKPNSWGLYDMHGNVWEWVQDNWHGDYNRAPTDGSSWEGGSDRVIRGGYWGSNARNFVSAFRYGFDPVYRNYNLGFRLLREE